MWCAYVGGLGVWKGDLRDIRRDTDSEADNLSLKTLRNELVVNINYRLVQNRILLKYNRITFTKSPSFCMTIFSTILINLTALLLQSHDSSYYKSSYGCRNTLIYAHTYRRIHMTCGISLSSNPTCVWRRLCGITPAILRSHQHQSEIP